MVIHSDDWGRVGVHDPGAIDRLRGRIPAVGASKWDYYGHETPDDLRLLGEVLGETTDIDGRPACMTVNMVMANADIRRMRREGFHEFRFVPITEGLPEPWAEPTLIEHFRSLATAGVFYPGLHGFTHFSPQGMLRGWLDPGEQGERTRALLNEDIPYLASATPEFNFALLDRPGGAEVYADFAAQRAWVAQGIDLFRAAFGHAPITTCAPGYRCNETTFEVWAMHGIQVVQTTGTGGLHASDGVMVLERNVFFEPLLDQEQAVERALIRIDAVVDAGLIPVICSHSINYISRHCGGRDDSLQCLARLLREVRVRFPDMRFANDAEILTAYRSGDPGWFRAPRLSESVKRHRLASALSAEPSE